MKMRSALLPVCVLAVLMSCSYGLQDWLGRKDPVSVRVVDPDVRPVNGVTVSAPFRFLVTADTHFGHPNGPSAARMSSFQDVINRENPAFVVFCGDLVENGWEGEFSDFRRFADQLTNASAPGIPMPWFCAIGNHDIYNDGWRHYKTWIGPSYYRFSAGGVAFYFIDSANGTVGDVQLELMRRDFAADPAPKIVVTHYPVRGNDAYIYGRITNTRERAILLDLFGRSRVRALFVGHIHIQYETDCGLFAERVCGSLMDSELDNNGYGWVVDVDAAGNVAARQFAM